MNTLSISPHLNIPNSSIVQIYQEKKIAPKIAAKIASVDGSYESQIP